MTRSLIYLLCALLFFACIPEVSTSEAPVRIVVLGNVQDAGSPQLACIKECCASLSIAQKAERMVTSLGLLDLVDNQRYILDASPDFVEQEKLLASLHPFHHTDMLDGIFITHAHIGHYAGLMYLGKESMNADAMPVYAMPRMDTFLRNNGPWEQLYYLENINIITLAEAEKVKLSEQLSITPLLVPHRDEYSETVGFVIEGPNKKALYLPDIDKWEKWNRPILKLIKEVDLAFIDATFYSNGEIEGRDMSEIPHPFVAESIDLFDILDEREKNKVHFIHMNHTNPLLNPESIESRKVLSQGYHIARLGQEFGL